MPKHQWNTKSEAEITEYYSDNLHTICLNINISNGYSVPIFL
jgi:hypothetical protein